MDQLQKCDAIIYFYYQLFNILQVQVECSIILVMGMDYNSSARNGNVTNWNLLMFDKQNKTSNITDIVVTSIMHVIGQNYI